MGEIEAARKVLVVDDDSMILRGFRAAFEAMGFEVETAVSSESTLALSRARSFDLIVIDFQLRNESGLDLIRILRVECPAAMLVLMTGYGSMDVAVLAMRAGANEVVQKPITAREIVQRLGGHSPMPVQTASVDRALWEHVTRVFADCHGNKSETARRLRKPRSWLQRFLARTAPRA